jgi:hypothetical protein
MAWKRSSVRSRPGPPTFQLLADTPLFSLVAFGSKTIGVVQLSRDRDLPGGPFDEEVLIDCLSKDVSQVSSHLEHSIGNGESWICSKTSNQEPETAQQQEFLAAMKTIGWGVLAEIPGRETILGSGDAALDSETRVSCSAVFAFS